MNWPEGLPQVVLMKIKDLRLNDGNPRTIRDAKFKKLVASLKEFPEMLALRPIIVNKDLVILGGNMRYRAAVEAGFSEVPVLIAENLTQAKELEFIIKDNVGFGDWDWEELANSWSELPLEDWGLDLPVPAEDDQPEAEKPKALKVIVLAKDEDEQDEIYNRLIELGYDVVKK